MNKTIVLHRSLACINARQEQVLELGDKYLVGGTLVMSTLETRGNEGSGATRRFCLKTQNNLGVYCIVDMS